MKISERVVGGVVILDLKGNMTLGENDDVLKEKVRELLGLGNKKLVLNMAGVPYIDAAGLGEIVMAFTAVARRGGCLKLLNLTKRILDILENAKLLKVFNTYKDEGEAIQSFE